MAGTAEQARINGKKGGRPIGSTTRPRFTDYCTPEDAQKLIELTIKKANEGDVTLLKYCTDHLMGKAPQTMNIDANVKVQPIPILPHVRGDKRSTKDKTANEED